MRRWKPEPAFGTRPATPFEISNAGGFGSDAWIPAAREHFCYPPKSYPQGAGAGSQWHCPAQACSRVWQAEGYRMVSEYPVGSRPEQGVLTGPKRWLACAGNDASPEEVGLYDWRDPGEILVGLWLRQYGGAT